MFSCDEISRQRIDKFAVLLAVTDEDRHKNPNELSETRLLQRRAFDRFERKLGELFSRFMPGSAGEEGLTPI